MSWGDVVNYVGQPVSLLTHWLTWGGLIAALAWILRPEKEPAEEQPPTEEAYPEHDEPDVPDEETDEIPAQPHGSTASSLAPTTEPIGYEHRDFQLGEEKITFRFKPSS